MADALMGDRTPGRYERVVEFVGDYYREHGRGPTVREIARCGAFRPRPGAAGPSSVVTYCLDMLVRDGKLIRIGNHYDSRSVYPTWAKSTRSLELTLYDLPSHELTMWNPPYGTVAGYVDEKNRRFFYMLDSDPLAVEMAS